MTGSSPVCEACGGDAFRLRDGALACAACGRARPAAGEEALAEIRGEVAALREELARLRQAVNFLNQRVR